MISVELSKRFKKIVRTAGREAEVSATLKAMVDGFLAGRTRDIPCWRYESWANTFTNAAPVWQAAHF